jgi:phosphopantetheinyl transferase (holo-ACP synthase)
LSERAPQSDLIKYRALHMPQLAPPSFTPIAPYLSLVEMIDIATFEGLWAQNPSIDEVPLTEGFTEAERSYCLGRVSWADSLAVRYAAKRAAAELSGARWASFDISRTSEGVPQLHGPRGPWWVSLSHDGGHAIAYVVCLSKSTQRDEPHEETSRTQALKRYGPADD